MRIHRVATVLLMTVLLAAAQSARGAEPTPAPEARSSPACARRVEDIRTIVDRAQRDDRVWTGAWAAGMAGLLTGNIILSQTTAQQDRVEYYFGIGGSALGLVSVLVGPFGEFRRLARLRARLEAGSGDPDVCALARGAERDLAEVAQLEFRAHSWIVHLGNVIVNAGLGLGLGAGYGHWRGAFLQTVGGMAIGEIQILTRPATAEKGLLRLQLRPLGAGFGVGCGLALAGHF